MRVPLPRYTVEQIEEHIGPFLPEPDSLALAQPERVALEDAVASTGRNSLGLSNGKIVDGREAYMRDMVLACLGEFIGTHGAEPTPEELYELAWPQYEDHVMIDVPGKPHRGATELMAQCRHTLHRFGAGRISSMPDIDAALARHEDFQATPPAAVHAPAAGAARPPPVELRVFRWRDPRTVPPRDRLYGWDYIRGYTSCTIAPGAAGKSSLLTVEALAMVSGKALLSVEPKRQLSVFMWNGEDPLEEVEKRVLAAMLAYGLTAEDIGQRLYIGSGRDMRLKLVGSVNRATQIDAPLIAQLVAQAQLHGIDVIMLDPLVAIHNISENDNVAIDTVVKEINRINEEAHVATMLAHHSRKTNGAEITAEDARGASALLAAVRSGRVINTMTKDEALRVGVKHPRKYFRVENGKANLFLPPERADWFELKGQQLGNGNAFGMGGDDIAVVFQFKMPDVFDGMTGGDTDRALWELRSGMWLVNPKATSWAGIAVAKALGLDISDAQAKARVKHMLKRWEQSGALRHVRRVDPVTRHERTFYEVVNDGGSDE